MMKWVWYLGVAALAALMGFGAYQWQANNQDVLLQNHGLTGGGFTLEGPDGPVSLSDYQGQPALIYFGYAYCPDVCPTSLAVMGAAMKQLEASGTPVKGIFISVDPDRDTPEKLKDYAPFYHPNMIGLTSDEHRILEVATRYGVYYKKVDREEGKAYLVDHTSRIYVINPAGELAALVSHGSTPEQVVEKVRAIL